MKRHTVTVHPSKAKLARQDQLAWKLAKVAADPVDIEPDVQAMIVNRVIDNAAVAVAALNRAPVANARAQALAHPHADGASLFGLAPTVCAEWAAWANGVAVRELDFHDTFLAADYAHPGDTIPPLFAVAQQKNCTGRDLVRGAAAAYEVHVNFVKAICLHKHKVDHMAHLCPATAAGLGALLGLEPDPIYQSVNQAVHTSFTTRQSRKGDISSWKAYVPGYSGMLAVLAVDRAMRGEKAPAPIYEGEDSVIAWFLDGQDAEYQVTLPEAGEAKRAILESYTKAHSAEYQAQAIIDLAFKLREQISDFEAIEEVIIHTSHHTHTVIGTGSGDPQKFDPRSSRETLDHSAMYIFAVALQDGVWHHEDSYTPERASREDTVRLWNKVLTVEDAAWTRAYHHPDPSQKAFGARVEIKFEDGSSLTDELKVADAHPNGAAPFEREDYIQKFTTLTESIITQDERDRFLDLVQRLPDLSAKELSGLNVRVENLTHTERDKRGIF